MNYFKTQKSGYFLVYALVFGVFLFFASVVLAAAVIAFPLFKKNISNIYFAFI